MFKDAYKEFKLGEPIISEKSEIEVLNEIGEKAKEYGYDSIFYKTRDISLKSLLDINGFELGWMHYILIKKDNNALISVYYDDNSMGSLIEVPYYEVYDFKMVNRYIESEKEEMLEYIDLTLKEEKVEQDEE